MCRIFAAYPERGDYIMYKSRTIRLELNDKQTSLCVGHAGVARHAWNSALNRCIELRSIGSKHPSAIDNHKWLVATIKKENSWYYNYSKCSPQQALRNLEKAFKNFHILQKESGYKLRDKNGQLKGFPNFKKKGVNDSFYLERNIKLQGNKIRLPIFGWIKCSETLPDVKVKSATIKRISNNWFVVFWYEFSGGIVSKKESEVGVDLGIKHLATFSNGDVIINRKSYENAKNKLIKQKKEVSRRFIRCSENQSSNYKKSALKLSKTYATVANIRRDVLHKTTSFLAKNFETVVIEDLKVKKMTKNRKLSSAILDVGFYEFKRQLLYKKEWYGGNVIIANQYYPSSKICSCCGNKKEKLKLSERTYKCSSCDTKIDRDLNAAINLKNLAVSSTVTAFGDESSVVRNPIKIVDELGIEHQMFTFV